MAYQDILKNLKQTPPRALNDHILIIDAMNTLIRSFSLLKAMNPTGTHVGGLVGFLRSLGYVTRIFDPTRVVIIWDGKGGSGNRQNIDPNYKAQRASARITHWGLYDTREEEQEALIGQLFRTRDYLDCLPVHQIVIEKLEADDIMAYLAKRASKAGKKVTIVSSDKDYYQLLETNRVDIWSPGQKKILTEDSIYERFGKINTRRKAIYTFIKTAHRVFCDTDCAAIFAICSSARITPSGVPTSHHSPLYSMPKILFFSSIMSQILLIENTLSVILFK